MDLSESELRALVREAIQAQTRAQEGPVGSLQESWRVHASHLTLSLVKSGDADGACLIEPTVHCNHCGYCLSYGH
jgi:hypothetical protein